MSLVHSPAYVSPVGHLCVSYGILRLVSLQPSTGLPLAKLGGLYIGAARSAIWTGLSTVQESLKTGKKEIFVGISDISLIKAQAF